MNELALGALEPLDYALSTSWPRRALTTPLLACTLVSSYYELDVTFATSEQAVRATGLGARIPHGVM